VTAGAVRPAEAGAGNTPPADRWPALAGLPDHYVWQYVECPGSDRLTVVLAPGASLMDRSVDFGSNVLFLADPTTTYFLVRAPFAAKAILAHLDVQGLRSVIFTGYSKGGFGAILLAGLCAKAAPRRAVHCVAFGPQTRLDPFNPRLADTPSYQLLRKRATERQGLAIYLEKLGDLAFVQRMPNLLIRIVYAEGSPADAGEAGYLCAPNIQKYPVAFPYHRVRVVADLRDRPREEIAHGVLQLQKLARRDADLAATLDADLDKAVDFVIGNRWLPDYPALLDQTVAIRLS